MTISKSEKITLILITVLVTIILGLLSRNSQTVNGSVAFGNDYISTSTRTAITGLAYTSTLALTSTTSNVTGTLGSVVITGAAAGQINIYDGTSTQTNSQFGTTTLVTFPASTAAGTYTFDLEFHRGLVIEIVGTAPTSTITYRP